MSQTQKKTTTTTSKGGPKSPKEVKLTQTQVKTLDTLDTVSSKIRYLDSEGVSRADISRVLGKRYQHVRNVLESDLKKSSGK